MRLAFALAALVLLATPACAADEAAMAKVVEGFYTVHQQSDQDGIPDAALRAKYAPFISQRLDTLLSDLASAQSRFAQKLKDSPPLVEGDLFSPNFEGISAFKVGTCTGDEKAAHCAVALHYAAKNPRPQDKPVDWTDTIYLVDTGSGWRVDDIAFGGNWDFGNHGRLSDVLKSAISDANG
jgi:hypothetical protein